MRKQAKKQPRRAPESFGNALAEAQELTRQIVETSLLGIIIFDAESGACVLANEAAARIIGAPVEKIKTQNFRRLQSWKNDGLFDMAEETLAAGTHVRRVLQGHTTFGRNVWINVIMSRFIANGRPHLLFMCEDINEQKRAEERLLESERRHKLISELTTDYFFKLVVAEDGNVTMDYVSDNFYSLTGRTREDASTVESWTSIMYPEDLGKVLALLSELIRKPQSAELECRSFIHGGKIRCINVIARSEWNEREGRVTSIVGAVKDITERKQAQEALQRISKLDSLGVLAGGIAHDFNNLLTGIYGAIDLARCGSKDAQATEYLQSALSTLNRAKALTMQLLTFSKGGAPIQKITPLMPFLQETARFALSGSNVSCRFSVAQNVWQCDIDKNQIGQVIDNIVINAQQAMPSGGMIEITARNISFKEKEHPPLDRGDYVKLSFKDSGIGIPKEILPRIFDPFYTTKIKGHGLGLATCYSIITRHGGCIEADSEPGKGSAFHVFLPASPEAAVAEKASVVKHRGRGVILVVDDEEAVREVTKKMLESLGYSVVCRNDGKAAIDFFMSGIESKRPLSGMIFDLTIPGGMGGKEAIAAIRKISKDIPVFVMSGYAEDCAMRNPVEYGFSSSISKPFTIAELSEMLGKHIKT